MIFDHWTYNQFYMERLSWTSQQNVPNSIHFTTEEIQWAIEQTQYKYFGSYEFTEQQQMAVEILVWVAKERMK